MVGNKALNKNVNFLYSKNAVKCLQNSDDKFNDEEDAKSL